jgi:hypothetical protein
MRRIASIIYVIPLLLILQACDITVKKAADQQLKIADAIEQVQIDTIAAYQNNIISKDIQDAIIQPTKDASIIQSQVLDILDELDKRGVTDFNSIDRDKVLKLLQATSAALDSEKVSAVARITDPNVKKKLQAGFESARGLITTLYVMLSKE